ncbi:MAG: DUF308 domain-containing protein [Clostridia bacterium]
MKILAVVMGVLLLVGGFYCLLAPGATFLSLGWIVGICMAINGIGLLFSYFERRKSGETDIWALVGAIFSVAIGLVVMFSEGMQLFTNLMIVYAAAIWVTVMGVLRIVMAIKMKQIRGNIPEEMRGNRWIWMLALGVVLLVLGVLGFMNPLVVAVTLGIMIGGYIIVSGVNMIALAIHF